MIFHLIILTTTSLLSQVKCRTYVPEKNFVDHNLNRRQTNNLTHNPAYNPTEQRQIVFVDKGQYPNGWNENIMKEYYRSPIIFSDKGPVTINYRGIHSGPRQPPDGFKNSCPIVISSQGKVTVNYDDSQDDVAPPSNQDICQLTNTMVELPSGIVLPYLKFKTISPYLLAEDQKSDILVILDNKNMTYKQFQETLRHYGCGDLEDPPRPSEIGSTDYVTLANSTLKVEMDDYRNIVSSLTSGSETLMVPNVVSGKYLVYRSLIADQLPELRGSAFVITRKGIVVPFSLYYAVDRELFQRPPTAAVVPCKVQQIKWGDGKLVDVQTVRHVIDALRTPTMISFVFPNGQRMPFVRCSLKEPTDSYDFDPEKVMVDVGQCKNVLLSHFNDILKAVHIPDDDYKNKRFNNPVVFALDPKCLNTTDIYNVTGPVNPQTNNNCTNILKAYTECNCKQILKTNETKCMINIKNTPTDDSKNPLCSNESTTNQTVTGCNENPTTSDNKNQRTDTVITTIVTKNNTELVNTTSNPSTCGKMDNITTIESKNNATENPDCAEIYIKNQQNSSSPITEGNKMPIVKSNNDQTESKNTMVSPPNLTSKNTTDSNTTTSINPNQATMTSTHQNSSNPVSGYKEEPTMNDNNQNQTETKNTTTIPNFVNNTSNSNITNPNKKYEPNSTSNSSVTTETRNNTTTDQNNYQNSSNPVIEGNTIPITTAGNNNQTETKDMTIISAPNITENTTGLNNTNTDKIYEPNSTSNSSVTTETRNNTTTDQNNYQNSSNPVIEGNTIPITTAGNNNQTETKDTTIISAPNITENTTGPNNTNTDKIYEPNSTSNSSVTTETRNNTTTDQNNYQNSSNPVIEGNTIPITTAGNNNQTETKDTTIISAPNIPENTTGLNNTNTDKIYEPNSTSNSSVITETRNNTTTDQNNYQNSSNPVIEGNTIPITTAGNNNQTETKDTTIISAPNITENTTGPNNTNTDKIYEHNETSNNSVTTEIRNNNTTDPNLTAVVPDNRQNDSNPVNRTNEIPAVTNANHYQNSTETINTTASTPNSTENTKVGSNDGRKDNDTYTGSNETHSVNNTAETIQTSSATRASDGADDVGPMENRGKIPDTNTTGIDDETPDVAYNSTMTGKKETNQPTPIYTETIKSPNNNSVTNNATKIINIVVF